MSMGPVDLPEDIESLRELAICQLDQNAQQLEQITEQSERIAFLEEYVRLGGIATLSDQRGPSPRGRSPERREGGGESWQSSG